MRTSFVLACLGGLLSATVSANPLRSGKAAKHFSAANPFILDAGDIGYFWISEVSRGVPVGGLIPRNYSSQATRAYIDSANSHLMIEWTESTTPSYYPMMLWANTDGPGLNLIGVGNAGYGPGTSGFALSNSTKSPSLVVTAADFRTFFYCDGVTTGSPGVELFWSKKEETTQSGCTEVRFKAVAP